MTLRPLNDRVIVKRLAPEALSSLILVILDGAKDIPDQGDVVNVGPGRLNQRDELVPVNVKVGDRVLFGKYSGQTIKVDGVELLVLNENDLFAVVEA